MAANAVLETFLCEKQQKIHKATFFDSFNGWVARNVNKIMEAKCEATQTLSNYALVATENLRQQNKIKNSNKKNTT